MRGVVRDPLLPEEVRESLGDIEEMATYSINIILLFLGVTLFACSKPTETQCDQAFDHYFSIKMKGVPNVIQKVESTKYEDRRAEFLSRCVGSVDKTVIRCWLDASTIEDIESCKPTESILR